MSVVFTLDLEDHLGLYSAASRYQDNTARLLDFLAELGFSYSSSVLPASNPLYGFPAAPAGPFLWPNGLIELPAPVARWGPLAVPILGGIYLRYAPSLLLDTFLRRAENGGSHRAS